MATPKFRSELERDNAPALFAAGFAYEDSRVRYPRRVEGVYIPDFRRKNLIIECKGRFLGPDRMKLLAVKAAHPELDIRLIFSNARARLSKTSKTMYGQWATKHGFKWSQGRVPTSWL